MSYDKIHKPNIFNDTKDDILWMISNAYMSEVGEVILNFNALSVLTEEEIDKLINFLTSANYKVTKGEDSYVISGWINDLTSLQ